MSSSSNPSPNIHHWYRTSNSYIMAGYHHMHPTQEERAKHQEWAEINEKVQRLNEEALDQQIKTLESCGYFQVLENRRTKQGDSHMAAAFLMLTSELRRQCDERRWCAGQLLVVNQEGKLAKEGSRDNPPGRELLGSGFPSPPGKRCSTQSASGNNGALEE